jgi:hypothetical protein
MKRLLTFTIYEADKEEPLLYFCISSTQNKSFKKIYDLIYLYSLENEFDIWMVYGLHGGASCGIVLEYCIDYKLDNDYFENILKYEDVYMDMDLKTDYENNYVYYNEKNKIYIDDFNIKHIKKCIT